jgi:hypothetical protein
MLQKHNSVREVKAYPEKYGLFCSWVPQSWSPFFVFIPIFYSQLKAGNSMNENYRS